MTPQEQQALRALLESFLDDSLILDVLEVVKSGKEATVYRCTAAPSTHQRFLAAKAYRAMDRRSFKNDSVYQQGRVILNSRARRAYQQRTEFGREVHQVLWVNAEFETQRMLHEAGAAVPRPWKCNGSAILMEWLGDDESPAMQLRHASLGPDEASELHSVLLANIELMLRHNIVHGDLSPFNILYLGREQGVRIIDFPQAVDPRMNAKAFELLHRDIDNVCRFFSKFGVRSDPSTIAIDLWQRFTYAQL